MSSRPTNALPFKSVGGALMFSVFLGPVGLLYASFWGGIVMTVLGFIIISSNLPYPIIFYWIACSIWSVGAANRYNRKLLQSMAWQRI